MSSATTMKSSAVGAARLLRASPPPLPTWPWESQIYGTHRLPSYQPPAYAPLGLLRSPLRHRSRPRPMLSCAPPCLPRPPSRPDPAQGHRIQAGRGGGESDSRPPTLELPPTPSLPASPLSPLCRGPSLSSGFHPTAALPTCRCRWAQFGSMGSGSSSAWWRRGGEKPWSQ